MNIDDIHITEYGPLSDISIQPGEFTVIFGKNEDGKSLLLESMLKLFYTSTSDRKAFGNMGRVSHNPTGHVFVEDDDGDRRKYADEAPLEDGFGVSAEDFRNLFVIQDSDVDIAEDDDEEEAYYEEMLDKVFNLDTQVINGIKDELQSIGHYTSTGKFTDRQGTGNIKSSVEDAEKLLDDIEQYRDEADEAGELQRELAQKKHRLKQLEREQDKLRKAEKREQYEEASQLLQELQECKEDLAQVEAYDEDGWTKWNDALNTIDEKEDELKGLREKLDEKSEELEELRDEIATKKQDATAPDRYEELNEELRPVMKNYRQDRDADVEQVDRDAAKSMAKWSAGSSGVAVVGATILGVMGVPWLPTILGLGAVVGLGTTMYFGITASSTATTAGTTADDVLNKAEDLGIDADSVAEVNQEINQVKQQKKSFEEEFDRLGKKETTLETEIDGLEDREEEVEAAIKSAKKTVEELEEDYELRDIDDYKERLKEKRRLESQKDEYETRLDQMLEGSDEEAWRSEVEDLADYQDEAQEIEYDQDRKDEIRNRINELDGTIKNIEDKLGEVDDTLQEFERRANQDVLQGSAESVTCDFVEDLDTVHETVSDFVESHEDRRDVCQQVESLLDRVEARQKDRLEHLFTGDDSASEIFSRVTDGAYEQIRFDSDGGRVEVVDGDGQVLDVGQLSLGTCDQLYFSVRVSLARELLDEREGFFLFDDAFIASDHDRLQRQLEILEELVDQGWQVLYFSAKKEVRELFAETADVHKLADLQG